MHTLCFPKPSILFSNNRSGNKLSGIFNCLVFSSSVFDVLWTVVRHTEIPNSDSGNTRATSSAFLPPTLRFLKLIFKSIDILHLSFLDRNSVHSCSHLQKAYDLNKTPCLHHFFQKFRRRVGKHIDIKTFILKKILQNGITRLCTVQYSADDFCKLLLVSICCS